MSADWTQGKSRHGEQNGISGTDLGIGNLGKVGNNLHIRRKMLNGSLIKDLISKDFLILTPEIRLSYQINLTLSQCKTKNKLPSLVPGY